MEGFRSFIETTYWDITVEEVGNLFENEIVGNYEPGSKKYRVSFHAPKNMRAWKTGDFTEDIVYVISDNAHTAKKIAQEWIAGRLDPRENDERPKRVPKSNYLRGTERRHFDMRSRVVGSWKQVMEMLGFAAERRQNTVDFIDEPELEILNDALSGRVKERMLAGLSEMERKGLRQLLLATKRNPDQWQGNHGDKARQLAQSLTVKLWKQREQDPFADVYSGSSATPAADRYSSYYNNSVYRRKLTKRDVTLILSRVHTYADAIREANRLGVTKSTLDEFVQSKYAADDEIYQDRRKVFADLYKRLRIPSSHNVFGDDHVSRYWQKRGFDWEAYATEVLPTLGLQTIRYRPDNPTYDDNAEYTDWAVEWLWDLYRQGPPQRKGTQAERYKKALEEILYDLMEQRNVVQPQPQLDDIPF
jgi:hypothetical protein